MPFWRIQKNNPRLLFGYRGLWYFKDAAIEWGIKLSGCHWPQHEFQYYTCCSSCKAARQWASVVTRNVPIHLSVPGKKLTMATDSQWKISFWVLAKGLLTKQMSHRMVLLFIIEMPRVVSAVSCQGVFLRVLLYRSI